MNTKQFQRAILEWYKHHKRDHLPWRQTRNAYHILLSEVMLQQTQVSRVLEKYPLFLANFPTLQSLSRASVRKLLSVWQGMGYNRRALYLQRTARILVRDYNGIVPQSSSSLLQLPGIGPYTAGAIVCFAFGQATVFLDTNIRKVYIHFFFPSGNTKISDKEILQKISQTRYLKDPRSWYYALMDYGSLVLNKKGLLERAKQYNKQSRFEGSTRYVRSRIVRELLARPGLRYQEIVRFAKALPHYPGHVSIELVLSSLERDGLIERIGSTYRIPSYSQSKVLTASGS